MNGDDLDSQGRGEIGTPHGQLLHRPPGAWTREWLARRREAGLWFPDLTIPGIFQTWSLGS